MATRAGRPRRQGRPGRREIDRLPAPTIQALSAWLRQNDVHILHFIGHGDYDDRIQDGVVYFQDRYGRSTKVSPTVLGPYLRDHDPLRLVLLNACQSARVDSTDPFSGMAQGLVQQDCTAVVAMQFPISDGAATAFTGEFYGALADGFPVDQAATSARKALIAEYAAEWATPVLFLRAPDGRVFDHIVAQPAVTAVPTPAPEVEAEDEERAQEALATDAVTTETKRKTAEEALLEPTPTPTGVQPEELKPVAATGEPEPAAARTDETSPEAAPLRGVAAAAAATAAGVAAASAPAAPPVTQALPTTTATPPPTGAPAYQPQQPTYQQPQQPTYQQQQPTYQQQQPTYQAQQPTQQVPTQQQPPRQSGPGQAPPRYVNPPNPKKPRWGLIITIVLAVVAVVFGGLAWYGSPAAGEGRADEQQRRGGEHPDGSEDLGGPPDDRPDDQRGRLRLAERHPDLRQQRAHRGKRHRSARPLGAGLGRLEPVRHRARPRQDRTTDPRVGHVPAVQGRRGELRVRDRPAEEQERLARDG